MSLSAAPHHRVLADVSSPAVPARSRWRRMPRSSSTGTALVAVAAQIAIPFWPVPLTAQTFAVLLVGVALGPLRGADLARALPRDRRPRPARVRAGHCPAASSPSPPAATSSDSSSPLRWSAGSRAARGTARCSACSSPTSPAARHLRLRPAVALRLAVQSRTGRLAGRARLRHADRRHVGAGMFPFLLGDLLKAVVAAALVPLAWKGVHALDARKQ